MNIKSDLEEINLWILNNKCKGCFSKKCDKPCLFFKDKIFIQENLDKKELSSEKKELSSELDNFIGYYKGYLMKELPFVEEEADDIFSDLISFIFDDNQKY